MGDKVLKKLGKSDKFKEIYGKFESNENEKNYNKLVKYLDGKKGKGVSILLSNNKPIYNSTSENNTFENYKTNTIPYENIHQEKSNKKNLNKNKGIHNEKIVTYHSQKIGPTLTTGYTSSCKCHYKDPISGQKKCCICGAC